MRKKKGGGGWLQSTSPLVFQQFSIHTHIKPKKILEIVSKKIIIFPNPHNFIPVAAAAAVACGPGGVP